MEFKMAFGDTLRIWVRDSFDSPPRRVEIPLGERRYVKQANSQAQAINDALDWVERLDAAKPLR
jgi:hypothetical protein